MKGVVPVLSIFTTTFNQVVPLFAVVFFGYALKRFGVIPESMAEPLNGLCFKVLFPFSCINSMLKTDMDVTYLWLVLYMLATFLISVAVFCVLVPKAIPEPRQAGVVVQGAFRSNSLLFALGLMTNIAGPDNLGPIMVLIALANLLFNTLAVVVLSHFSGDRENRPPAAAQFRDVITNPLIVGTVLGIILRLMPFTLPQVVLKPVSDLAGSALPMAMLAIGLRLSFRSVRKNIRPIALSTFLKLVFMPLVWTAVAVALGFGGLILTAIFIEHSCPSATGGVAMADAMGCDGTLAGEICLVQTVLSCFTIFIGVFVMRMLGLMA